MKEKLVKAIEKIEGQNFLDLRGNLYSLVESCIPRYGYIEYIEI